MNKKGYFLIIVSLIVFISIAYISNVKISILAFAGSTFILSTIFLFSNKFYEKFINYIYIIKPDYYKHRVLSVIAIDLVSISLYYNASKFNNIKLENKDFLFPYVISPIVILLFIAVASHFSSKIKDPINSFALYIFAGILSTIVLIIIAVYTVI